MPLSIAIVCVYAVRAVWPKIWLFDTNMSFFRSDVGVLTSFMSFLLLLFHFPLFSGAFLLVLCEIFPYCTVEYGPP